MCVMHVMIVQNDIIVVHEIIMNGGIFLTCLHCQLAMSTQQPDKFNDELKKPNPMASTRSGLGL